MRESRVAIGAGLGAMALSFFANAASNAFEYRFDPVANVPRPPIRSPRVRTGLRFNDRVRARQKRYKGSNSAKRATARGGNPARWQVTEEQIDELAKALMAGLLTGARCVVVTPLGPPMRVGETLQPPSIMNGFTISFSPPLS